MHEFTSMDEHFSGYPQEISEFLQLFEKCLCLKNDGEETAVSSYELLHAQPPLYSDHDSIIRLMKKCQARERLVAEMKSEYQWQLTPQGLSCCLHGTPENRLITYLQTKGEQNAQSIPEITKLLGKDTSVALDKAVQKGWITIDKATQTVQQRSLIPCQDQIQAVLKQIQATPVQCQLLDCLLKQFPDQKPNLLLQDLKKRRLIKSKDVKLFLIKKGPRYKWKWVEPTIDLTQEILTTEQWKTLEFRPYNFFSSGKKLACGTIHPLMKMREMFRQILLLMGFEEMPTNRWVEMSFWNFDALFMPQQHPARDIQDTFFMKNPEFGKIQCINQDYVEKVKQAHEIGCEDSVGWRYTWSPHEASKNILRTHTTAISCQMLKKLGDEYRKTGIFYPKKYFSIDRVFRNENLDATHLNEFHQIEGVVADWNLGLQDLIGVLKTFYSKIGLKNLKFKPAYNPYTEPSLEIFGYHPILNKWIEVGNSGIFRPEMTLPMGLPKDVHVIAWGLSLERPTMIQYGIHNIRELFGHQSMIGASYRSG